MIVGITQIDPLTNEKHQLVIKKNNLYYYLIKGESINVI